MRVLVTPLTLFSLVVMLAQPAQITPTHASATETVPWHPCAMITAACTGGLCSLRRQDGFWAGSRLYSADYRDAATEARHEGLAANRPGGRGGMQGAESEFRKGWPS